MIDKTKLRIALAGLLAFASTSAQAQVYFSENFDTETSESLVTKGWDLGKNEFALEEGAEFAVVPPYLRSDPGGDFRNPAGDLYLFPPTADGTQSTGRYLLTDSDAAGGSDNIGSKSEFWAITPKFSTTGSTAAWLHVDTEIENNNNGECIVDFAVSIDGGQTWLPIWQTAEPQRPIKGYNYNLNNDPDYDGAAEIGGYPKLGSASQTKSWSGLHGRVHLKLPAEANDKADVRARFRYYEPADAWWIALDNLVIDNNAAPMGTDVVLTEDFKAGIPATWKNTPTLTQKWGTEPVKDAAGKWLKQGAIGGPLNIDLLKALKEYRPLYEVSDEAMQRMSNADFEAFPDLRDFFHPNAQTDGRFLVMLAGGDYALWHEGPSIDEAANLDTPSLDLSSATVVFLDFDSEWLHGNASAFYEVFASADGGANFSRILTYQEALSDRTEASYFMHHYLEVPALAGAKNAVFRFHAQGGDPDQFEGFWAIDNVRVTANKGGSAPTLSASRQGGTIAVSWDGGGTLESASDITGPWSAVAGATSPHSVTPAGSRLFLRVRR
ncbi:MAG: hypothetical protein O2960_01815 [Verrucomicrobia bacterium]|nr:hypothetical protein [Verrucomicrobiota bacterium]